MFLRAYKIITGLSLYVFVCSFASATNSLSAGTTNYFFEENKGQVLNNKLQPVKDVLYRANVGNVDVYVTTKGLVYYFKQIIQTPAAEATRTSTPAVQGPEDGQAYKYHWCRIDMELTGATIQKQNTFAQNQVGEAYANYYLSHEIMVEKVYRYQKIVIKNIYPGIDWIIYSQGEKGLKYDFVVSPGANADQIKINYKGIDKIEHSANGGYTLKTPYGNLQEGAVASFYNENKSEVNSSYEITNTEVKFKLGSYDHNKTIVIDPPVAWITYFGGTLPDKGFDICTDPSGNLYLFTQNASFDMPEPATQPPGAYLQQDSAGSIAYAGLSIAKFSKAGVLLWSTYYGVGGYPGGIASDSKGIIYVSGFTSGSFGLSFPWVDPGNGAFVQKNYLAPNARPGFIGQFNSQGQLTWGTLYGGTVLDRGYAVTVDAGDNLYVAGTKMSSDFPQLQFSNPSAFYTPPGGGTAAIFAKFNKGGKMLLSTTIGGQSITSEAFAITTNPNKTKIVVSGWTNGQIFVGKNPGGGAYCLTTGIGGQDMFVAEFDTACTYLWGTLYGSDSWDKGDAVAVDKNDNIYLGGMDWSSTFPMVDPGGAAYMETNPSAIQKSAIVKFDKSRKVVWSTYIGQNSGWLQSMTVDDQDHVFMNFDAGQGMPQILPSPAYLLGNGTGTYHAELNDKHQLVWGDFWGISADPPVGTASTNQSKGSCYDPVTQCVYYTGGSASGAAKALAGAYNQAGAASGQDDAYIIKLCPQIIIKDTVIPPTCISPNGTAIAQPEGGTQPYTYSWSNGQTTQIISNVAAGNYTVTVTDAAGISATTIVVVTAGGAAPLTLGSNTAPTSCTSNTGAIYSSPSGGVPTYTYSWSNGQTGANATGLAGGTYSLTVTDSQGCTKSIVDLIKGITVPVLTLMSTATPTCFTSTNGSANVYTPPYNPPNTYSWSTGLVTTTEQITGLGPGTYTVTVTDNNSCSKSLTVTLTSPPDIEVTFTSTPAACGASDGSLSAVISGGTPNGQGIYTYYWLNTFGTLTVTGLAAGTYSMMVYDSKNCSKTVSGIVNNTGGGIASAASTAISCNGIKDATASASVAGGNGPYTYSWSTIPSQTTTSVSGLGEGTYTVQVTDGNGCISSDTVNINEPDGMSLSVTPGNATCGGTGTATVSVTGGTANYSYSWSGTGQTTGTVTGLAVGGHTVLITDANGCTKSSTTSITTSGTLSANTTSTLSGCVANGTATVTPTSGTGPYTYSWSSSGGADSIASNLVAGTYSVSVVDANNCSTTASVTVSQSPAVLVSASATAANCGSSDGSATATGSGGVGPYTYSWNTAQSDSAISNLAAGTYTVTITDSKLCTSTATVTVNSSGGPVATLSLGNPVSCYGGNNAVAVATPQAGSGNYTYSWSNNQTTSSASNLSAGTYSVTVTENGNCPNTYTITIIQPGQLIATPGSTPSTCTGSTGSASVSVVGGTASYSYSWNSGQTTANISNVVQGNYTVIITDANGCKDTATAVVGNTANFTAGAASTPVDCYGSATGTASASPNNSGTAPYNYSWSNGQTVAVISNLSIGDYTVIVTDANGCLSQQTVSVLQPDSIYADTASTPTIQDLNNGTAAVVVTGGSPVYSYSWNNGQTTSTATGLSPGNYSITITDGNGCIKTAIVKVSEIPICAGDIFVPTAFSPNGDGMNDIFYVRAKCLTEYKIRIYDRWGEKVFESTDILEGWNGTYKGEMCDPAIFVYYITGVEAKGESVEKKGNVTLVR